MAGDNIVHFSATRLIGTGKEGILTPDADGYYELILGGLNVLNSANQYYTLSGAEELFKSSSTFMRRINDGCVLSEVGHPKITQGMTTDDYIGRILSIDETNVCAHISEVWLDKDYGKNHPELSNPNLVAIMGKVKPAGVKGDALKQALDNPKQNVCFSIRALTKNFFQRGQENRVLVQIMTFDWVTEPGIFIAKKWNAPGIESLVDRPMNVSSVLSVVQNMSRKAVGMESSTSIHRETESTLQRIASASSANRPGYEKW